jgi:TolA-binding protein
VLTPEEGDEFVRRHPKRRVAEKHSASDQAAAAAKGTARQTSKQRYKAAERLEASDPAAAIAVYREVAEAGGPWAANALFAQARLELERGNRATAAHLLRRYLKRYPNGANRRDATVLLQRLE